MPNTKSAKKRMRTSEESRQRNRMAKSRVTSTRQNVFEACEKKTENASAAFREYCSALDKAAKHGVIKKNTAIRRKRRAAVRVAAIAPA